MKKFITFCIKDLSIHGLQVVLLIIFSFNISVAQTNISSIRFGSTGDPLNGLTVAWDNDNGGTTDSIAWGYTAELDSGRFAGVMSTSIIGTRFEYTFPTLSPESILFYSLFDSKDSVWLEEQTFNTASDDSDNHFSFTVLGDSRSNPDQWGIISSATLPTDFTLFMGDIINDGRIRSDWEAWFDYGEDFISRETIYHCVGNHDDDSSPSGFDNFLGLYTQPGNELYYSFNYGNAVFICLNSERAGDVAQYNWLIQTLEENKDKTWKIVFFHKPYYTAPSHTGEMDGYFNTWWKAFDDYGVDMIFNGHTHNYQRTKPINRNISTNSAVANYGSGDGQGRCQIVAGNAGAPLSSAASSSLWWLDNSASKRHFCNIEIDGNKLVMKAMDAANNVFDSLALNKSISEVTYKVDLNQVVDQYDGGNVWLVFGAWDSSFVMTDNNDGIYSYKLSHEIGTELRYFFSYQNGPNPDSNYVDESLSEECSDAEGYRILQVPYGNVALPPVLFGSCNEAPVDVTFQVDLSYVTDLYEGGAVWLAFGAWDSYYELTDADSDSTYNITLPLLPGTELQYFFSYQNGSNPDSNYVEESVYSSCGDDEGYRLLKVPDELLILPAIMFGSCIEDPGPAPSISVPIASGSDDGEEKLSSLGGDAKGSISLSSSDLEIIFDHEPQSIGLLFRDIKIPYGASITKAYIQFTVDVVKSGTTNIDLPQIFIYGAKEETVDAITATPFSISSHPRTSAQVSWAPGASLLVGNSTEAERTSDISTIIKEIVDQDKWAGGNNILIVVTGNGGQTQDINREYESYNGDANAAPVLNVEFNIGGTTNAEHSTNIPNIYKLEQNYPNPFNPATTINYQMPQSGKVKLVVYDIMGREIATLVDEHQSAGRHQVKFNTKNITSGVYLYTIRSGKYVNTKKMLLLK